ncbi:MAG: ATP-binding protein [Bacteroidales bacterium]|nr:ATP-binding protein [Bacteroidales bacterium]
MKTLTDKTNAERLGLPVDFLETGTVGYHYCIHDLQDGSPFVYISPRFLEIVGWTREEIAEKFNNRFCEMLHPADSLNGIRYNSEFNEVPESLRLGKEDKVYRIMGKEGYIWVTGNAREVIIDGKSYIEATISNITSHMTQIEKAQKSLEETTSQMHTQLDIIQAVAGAFHCLYYIDLTDYSFVQIGQTTTNIRKMVGSAGVDARAALKMVCSSQIVEEDRATMLEFTDVTTLRERLKDKAWVSCEYCGLTKGWSEGIFIASGRDDEGQCTHVVWAVRVIHQQKVRELASQKELINAYETIANAKIGIWEKVEVEGEAPRLKVNPKMRELAALPMDVTDEVELYNIWKSRVKPEYFELLLKTSKSMSEGNVESITYEWVHPELGVRFANWGGTGETIDGKIRVVRGYQRDITFEMLRDQEQLKALEAANKAKTDFLFNMSHDIRTPMNAILGFSQLMRREITDPKLLAYQDKIEKSSNLLLSIINNVLDMARIESGKMELDEDYERTDEVLSEIFSVFDAESKKKHINFLHHCYLEHKYVLCDKTKLKQIFLNLLSNAVKYTPEGGTITVVTQELPSAKAGYTIFETRVIDTGIGMSQDYLPQLFDSFTRERTSTSSKVIGTGLGMAIVKRLVDLMHGTIQVESELGVGTTFTVTFEYKIGDNKLIDNIEAKVMEMQANDLLKGKHILLAEDNLLNAEIATIILEDLGMTVEHVEDGIQCTAKMEQQPAGTYDLILMDVQMPNMDGYKATQHIRRLADKGKANIPIVAMTANAFEEDKKNALDAGMNEHIAKPIDVKAIVEKLSKILGQ